MQSKQAQKKVRTVIQVIVYALLVPMLPLLLSQRWDWWEAWAYAIICILSFFVSRYLVMRVQPDLIKERGKFLEHENTQPWDKVLAPLVGLGGNLIPLVAGLDARYSALYPFSLGLKILAMVLFTAGIAWGTWALLTNRFFSGVVRLQTDRDHHVINSGPYRFMRHPGYAGAVLNYLAAPVFLSSLWAFVPAIFFVIVVVIRTRLEDRFLQAELSGYADYAQEVRYRLFPGIW